MVTPDPGASENLRGQDTKEPRMRKKVPWAGEKLRKMLSIQTRLTGGNPQFNLSSAGEIKNQVWITKGHFGFHHKLY